MPDRLRLRCIWPDRWLETRLEVASATALDEVKRQALEAMLRSEVPDAAAYYVEVGERKVRDESITLEELDLRDGAVLTIRAHDLHHPPPFRG